MRTLLLVFAFTLQLSAERSPERVVWCRTPEAFAGRQIEVRLLSGERVSGAWAAVTGASFTLKSSNGKSRTFARQEIRSVRASRRRVRGRLLGAAIGFYSVAGLGAAATRSPEALQGSWGLAAVGAGVAGYFVGKSLDRDTRTITLLASPGCD